MRSRALLILSLALLSSAPSACAQDFTDPGMVRPIVDGARIATTVQDVTPGDAEWTFFVGGGGGGRSLGTASERGVGMVRLGGEFTVPLLNLGGGYGGPVHLRVGPYVLAETSFEGGLGEGGVSLTIGQVPHAHWGTFGIRFGGGVGGLVEPDGVRRTTFVSATISWGVLSVPGRYRRLRSACDPVQRSAQHLYSSGVRVFATGRAPLRGMDDGAMGLDGFSVVIGVEIEPGFLLEGPYSLERLIDAR